MVLGRTDPELVAESCDQRLTRAVAPVRVDDKRVFPAGDHRSTHLLVRENPTLDSPGIEQHRVAGSVLIPEFHVQRKERIVNGAASLIQQADVAAAAAQTHGCRKRDVEPELILRHFGGAGKHRNDPRRPGA